MSLIYEPRGKAREYSPLAINIFTGCPHGCKYCYVPEVLRITPEQFFHNRGVKKSFSFEQLERDAMKIKNSKYPVFFSFTSDPYPDFDQHEGITRRALLIMLKYNIPVIILSKGGRNWERDFDVFEQFGNRMKLGVTLTSTNTMFALKHEPHSAPPSDRMQALRRVHDSGFLTWASIEPVINPKESLQVIEQTLDYIGEYRIGKISGNTEEYKRIEKETDWNDFVIKAATMLRQAGKRFYIKQELAKIVSFPLTREETDLSLFDTFIGDRQDNNQEISDEFGQLGLI